MSATKSTFEATQLPFGIRAFAAVANTADAMGVQVVDLNIDHLKAAAEKNAGNALWNDPQLVADIATKIDFVSHDPDCSILAKINLRTEAIRHLTMYLKLQAAKQKHPDLTDKPVKNPFIILGLPRTGTTLLQRLLSQDPASHGPALWEMFNPVRIDEPDAPEDREKAARTFVQNLQSTSYGLWAVHTLEVHEADECYFILPIAIDGLNTDPALKYFDWFQKRSALGDYALHKQYLQAMHYHKTARRWVLKSPLHMPKAEDLLATYPDAQMIWCHRGLSHVIASWTSFVALQRKIAMKRVDAHAVGVAWLKVWQVGLAAAERARAKLSPEQCFDVHYEQLVADPIQMVRTIYRHFGMELSVQAEKAMRDWLDKDKQKQKLGHRYSLDQFGFTPADLERSFADYVKKYNVSVD
jgi:hypothetical protein